MIKATHMSREALQTLTALREAVEHIRKLHPKMELGTLLVYLMTAEAGEVNLKKIEAQTRLSKSALSRNAKLLGTSSYTNDEQGNPEPGLGLIRTIADPFDNRAYLAMPTALGRSLAQNLADIFTKRLKEPNGT